MPALIHRIVDNMSFDSVVGVAGLLLSILALIQAKSAEKMAQEAKREVQKNRQTSDLSRLSGGGVLKQVQNSRNGADSGQC